MVKTTALLAAAALGLAACGSSSGSNTSTSSSSSSSSTSAAAGGGYGGATKQASAASSSGSSSNEVDMYDDYFKPKAITGKPGSTVKIEVKNDGSNLHNFKIDSQKQANADVAPGKNTTVSVRIPSSGSIQFYCEYHKGLGMVGTVKPS